MPKNPAQNPQKSRKPKPASKRASKRKPAGKRAPASEATKEAEAAKAGRSRRPGAGKGSAAPTAAPLEPAKVGDVSKTAISDIPSSEPGFAIGDPAEWPTIAEELAAISRSEDLKFIQETGTLPPHLTAGNPGNSGGKKGRSGRKPNWFKEFASDVLEATETQNAVRRKMVASFDPGYGQVLKTLAEYAFGKPDQKLLISHEDLTGRVAATADLLQAELPPELFALLEPRLVAIWNGEGGQASEVEAVAASVVDDGVLST